MMDIAALLAALLSGPSWDLTPPRHELPADVLTIADPTDPLAQSRLWGALYPELPLGFLVEICLVESGCDRAIGVHEIDAKKGPSVWAGVWKRGVVDRSCGFYPSPEDASPRWLEGASTRGNHGLMAGYHVSLLGDCVPLDVFDLPFFSGWVAAEKSARICDGLRRRGKRCTAERLRCLGWGRARLGSKKCGRVIKRWRSALARRLAERPELDPRERFTLNRLRKERHGEGRPESH